jgi:hypothetical protein
MSDKLRGWQPDGNSDGRFVWEQQKSIPKVSYEAHKARGKKTCVRHLLLHKIPKFIQKRKENEVYVQNINSIFLELS